MAYAGLKDGGLSVKIGGVEHVSDVHGLEWETTSIGDGGGSFWIDPVDPFAVRTTYPEFRVGAAVDVIHTYDSVTTQLYKGFILSDPKTGTAGEKAVLTVETGGVLEVARWRGDTGFIYTDSDPEQWFENKKNPKWASVEISETLELRVDKGTKVPNGKDRAAAIGYLIYQGSEYLYKGHTPAGPLNGIKRMTGYVTTKLDDGLRAGIYWSPTYKVSRNPDDYTGTVKFYNTDAERHLGNKQGGKWQDYSVDGTDGAGYLILTMWNGSGATVEVKEDQLVRIDGLEMYTDTNEKRVDQAMVGVADFIGLHDTSTTADIGSVLQNLVARPPTDPISAMNTFVQQADCLVQWGWWGYWDSGTSTSKIRFYARPLEKNPTTIRAASNCYEIDAVVAGTEWDVRQHPEDGSNWKGIRFYYGRKGSTSNYPAGFPDSVFYPGNGASWGNSDAFIGATARVLPVDFTGHNYGKEAARKLAKRLWTDLGSAQSSGPCRLRQRTVNRWATTTARPVPYIKGGDFVECKQSSCGPLLVTRAHVDLDSEAVDLDLGLQEEALLEQLEAAGAIKKVKLAKHRRPGWRSRK